MYDRVYTWLELYMKISDEGGIRVFRICHFLGRFVVARKLRYAHFAELRFLQVSCNKRRVCRIRRAFYAKRAQWRQMLGAYVPESIL